MARFALGAVALVLLIGTAAAEPFDFKGSRAEGHQRYVAPVANPLFNETPYITTELRPIWLHNAIPNRFVSTGGRIDVIAAELRIALTDRLGFIASKDGYVRAHFNNVLPDEEGFANISAGFKYAVYSDPATNTLLTLGIEYEPPSGYLKTAGISLQGRGGGFLDLFATGTRSFGPFALQGSIGYNHALDSGNDSSILHYSAHVDIEVAPGVFPMLELNGFSVVNGGRRLALDVEGVDLVNFGSTQGGTVITAAVGTRYRLNQHVQFGAAYEAPITGRQDILEWRFYLDAVLSF
jgi:hypothetical protein